MSGPASPGSDPGGDDPENSLRILLATDIHLGCWEKQPERAGDSYNTFEEILQIARDSKVDMLLLGGDLFHENKPTRDAEKRCLDLLNKYVLGDGAIQMEFLSDPEVNFAHCQRRELNYMNEHMNIGLPVFSIHGNHDDPSGLGGHSCMDLLHSSGLINYFGRIDNLDDVTVTPLLIRKGGTRMALYGMSAMKDERLHRLFRAGKVRMLRPEESISDWFNLLVLHQNRSRHGPTNYIPEYFIEPFVDLVFWGHEHECRVDPEIAMKGDDRFFITQPGSSVATSLCEGEAKQKCVGLLTVCGKDFKIDPIPLRTVRPLVFRTVSLDQAPAVPSAPVGRRGGFKDEQAAQQARTEAFLRGQVEEMLEEAEAKRTGHPKQPLLPLLRIRVEYADEAQMITPGRFGNAFHDRVANPSEILLFRRKVVAADGAANGGGGDDFAATHMDSLRQIANSSSMEDLIQQYFATTKDEKAQLKLLGVKGIAAAVSNFIEKDDTQAITLIVDKQLDRTRTSLRGRMEENDQEDDDEMMDVDCDLEDEDGIDEALGEFRRKRVAKVNEGKEARELLDGPEGRIRKPQQQQQQQQINDFDLGDDDDPPPVVPSSSASKPRGRGRGRGAGTARGRGRAGKAPIVEAFSRQSQQTNGSRSSPRKKASNGRGGGRKRNMYVPESDSD